MKQWDSVVESYMAVCEARGVGSESMRSIRGELERCGCWLKRRRKTTQAGWSVVERNQRPSHAQPSNRKG